MPVPRPDLIDVRRGRSAFRTRKPRVSASRPMVESADRVERGRPAIEPVLSDAEDEEIMLPEDTDIAEPSTYSERNRKSPRREPVNVETPDCNFRAFKRYAGPFAPF